MSVLPIRVLVVDDHEDGANAMATVFRLDGHAVEVASDGEKAIESACEMRPDLVLLDLALGRTPDGFEGARGPRGAGGRHRSRKRGAPAARGGGGLRRLPAQAGGAGGPAPAGGGSAAV